MNKKLFIGLTIAASLFTAINAQAADPVTITYTGTVKFFQCPYADDPGYYNKVENVSLALAQKSDGSYQGELVNIDLMSYYNDLSKSSQYSSWNWSNFSDGQPTPSSNTVTVSVLSYGITTVGAVVGGVKTSGLVNSDAFNVGSVTNIQCTSGTNPIGMELHLYSNPSK